MQSMPLVCRALEYARREPGDGFVNIGMVNVQLKTRTTVRIATVISVAASLMFGPAAFPASAQAADVSLLARVPLTIESQLSGLAIADTSGNDLGDSLVAAAASGATESTFYFGVNGQSKIVIRTESVPAPGLVGVNTVRSAGASPQWNVGFGKFIYVYLSRDDFFYIANMALTAALSYVCWLLVESGVGTVACAIAALLVTTYIVNKYAPPVGYCKEFKFGYNGSREDMKNIQRVC